MSRLKEANERFKEEKKELLDNIKKTKEEHTQEIAERKIQEAELKEEMAEVQKKIDVAKGKQKKEEEEKKEVEKVNRKVQTRKGRPKKMAHTQSKLELDVNRSFVKTSMIEDKKPSVVGSELRRMKKKIDIQKKKNKVAKVQQSEAFKSISDLQKMMDKKDTQIDNMRQEIERLATKLCEAQLQIHDGI